jgi:site-specific recombinase XerD
MSRRAEKKIRGVFERPIGSGVWWICYFVNGRKFRERAGSKSEAVARYQLRKTQAREGRLPNRATIPYGASGRFDDFVHEFLENERLRIRAYEEYARHGRVWIERFGSRALRNILPLDIQTWATRRRQEVAPATVNRELSFLRRIFNVAIANGLVEKNPVKQIKFYREPSGRVRWLADEEEARLREEIGEKRWPLVAFAVHTGLRQGEQFNLRWKDVDLQNGVLTIPRSKHGGVRHVPLSETALTILRDAPSRLHSAYVFPSTTGQTPLNATNFRQRVFEPALRRAGIADFRWHDLRHSFASRLVMRGADLRTVQELLGHRTLAMTIRYSHLAPAHLQSAVRLLDAPGKVQNEERSDTETDTAPAATRRVRALPRRKS